MTLVKHSQRTTRKGCKFCGSKDGLYWAHDTDRAPANLTPCPECQVTGGFVLVTADLQRHLDTCPKAPARKATPAVPDAPKADTPAVPKEWPALPDASPEPKAETVPAVVPQDDAAKALAALMGALAPKVDAETVRAMVKAELEDFVYPTRTVVIQPSGERHDVPGLTHVKLADVVTDLSVGEHVLMVGPAGTGKSTIAEQAANALGIPFYGLSLSPQTPSSAILGYMTADGTYIRTLFRDAYETGGLFHFDEVDNGHAQSLTLVNAALANGQMAFPDGMVKRHPDFRCAASGNTYGRGPNRKFVRNQLDSAFLDRFSVETIEIDPKLERELCRTTALDKDKIDDVLRYTRKLRDNANRAVPAMTVDVSPRASFGMCRLLAAGRSWNDVVDVRARRGLSADDWAKLSAGTEGMAVSV